MRDPDGCSDIDRYRMYKPVMEIVRDRPGVREEDIPPALEDRMGLTDEQMEPPERRDVFLKNVSGTLSTLQGKELCAETDGCWSLTASGERFLESHSGQTAPYFGDYVELTVSSGLLRRALRRCNGE